MWRHNNSLSWDLSNERDAMKKQWVCMCVNRWKIYVGLMMRNMINIKFYPHRAAIFFFYLPRQNHFHSHHPQRLHYIYYRRWWRKKIDKLFWQSTPKKVNIYFGSMTIYGFWDDLFKILLTFMKFSFLRLFLYFSEKFGICLTLHQGLFTLMNLEIHK